MPSHSVKQAKVMSAIAHGWRPSGKAADIPVKVAKEFHAADAGKKYGKGMPKSRKRQSGGNIPIRTPNTLNAMMQGVEQDPLNPHAQLGMLAPYAIPGAPMPSARLKRPVHIDEKSDSDKEKHYQAGGELPDIGEPLIPSGGQFSPGIPAVNKAADIGSRLAGNAVIGAATLPYRYPKAMIDAAMTRPGSEEAHQAYGDVGNVTGEMGLNMIGPKGGVPEGSTFGVFVGPYGAKALQKSHAEGMADRLAQEALERGENPQAVWRQYGWSTGPEGKARKEIQDLGATLVKNPDGEGYLLKHPAGDFHKLYDIPPIQFDPNMKGNKASFDLATNQIKIAGKPTKENIAEAIPAVLHEVQHGIQKKEGFAVGANLKKIEEAKPEEFSQEYYGSKHPLPSWQMARLEEGVRKLGIDPKSELGQETVKSNLRKPNFRRKIAAYEAYLRSGGEAEAHNVMDRYSSPEKYGEYPEFTERVPRGIQHITTYEDMKRKYPEYFKGVGGPIGNQRAPQSDRNAPPSDDMDLDPNISGLRSEDRNRIHPDNVQEPPTMRRFQMGGFNPEKAMSIGLSRRASQGSGGLLKSQIPGRTDQIQASIPKGAYIIPADVVSGMGQGNTDAGGAILGKLMNRGPFGMNLPKRTAGSRVGSRHSSLKFSKKFDDGGGVGEPEPVLAAGGEYVVMPHEVAALGAGDVDTGHNILDAFVKHMREKTISTMRKLPGPKGAKK